MGKIRKRSSSLSGLLTFVFAFFAAAVLLLLICMDWYLINSYQLAKREQEAAVLENAVSEVRTDMERINKIIYEFYESSDDLKALSGKLTDLEKFSHSYDLNEALKGRLILEDCLHGHFLFYDGAKSVRYFMDTEIVDFDDVYELRVRIKDQIQQAGANWQWFYTVVNGSKYGLLLVNYGNASLCQIYNLSYKEQVMTESAMENCRLFFVQTGGGLMGRDDGEYAELLEKLSNRSGSYSCKTANSYLSAREIGKKGLWLCMEVKTDLLFYMSGGQLLLLFVTFFTVLGIVAVQRQMRESLLQPLHRLVQTMNRVRDGEWEAKVESADFEEIQRVNDALESMVGEIQKQKILTYEHMLEKQQTQMRFLQLQLKPHFYLNGLKPLNAMVMEGDRDKMQDLIINLSEHLRYLLQAERETVPLQAEVDYVRNYTELQKNMTGRPFRVTWDIAPTRRSWQVPILCIQTFLENSFKYAKMGNAQKELLLRITIRELETQEGAYLDICIRDNGCGYPEEVLDCINEDPEWEGRGVGIKNLQRRCTLLYAGRAEYNFYNDNGAVSELSLPWKGEA